MSTEIWYLLFNDEKELLCAPYKAEVRDIADLKRAIEEQFSELNVKAHHLVVWQCKEPRFLSTQPKKLLQRCLSEIDFLNEEKVVELVSGAEIADLELGKKEVLLVQVPGAISNSSFFSCSQYHPLDLHSKKQPIEEQNAPLNPFIQGENSSVLTARSGLLTITLSSHT